MRDETWHWPPHHRPHPAPPPRKEHAMRDETWHW